MPETKNFDDLNYIVNPWRPTAQEVAFGSEHYTGGYFFPKPVSDFSLFTGTPYEVTIPVSQGIQRPEIQNEISYLAPNVLINESFQNFYRHIDMLPRFATSDQIARFLPAILERSKEEAKDFSGKIVQNNESLREKIETSVYVRVAACLEACREDPDLRLPEAVVKQIYKGSLSFYPYVPFALTFDRRNKMYGESIDVAGRLKEYVQQSFSLDQNQKNTIRSLLEWVPQDPDLFPSFLIYSLARAKSESEIREVVQEFANIGGVEQIRKALREHVRDNPSFEPIFKTVFEFFGFDPKDPLHDLKEGIYERIDFSEYKPNKETQEFDLDLLKKEFGKEQSLLDVACGTGRHLMALDGQEGRRVAGIDIVGKHIDYIKSKKPDADVKVASWFNMPYEDQEFDGTYCLGRSLTHNTTIPDMVAALREMGRVIKDNGKLIVDMPDSRYGDIHQDMLRAEAMRRKNGLTDYLEEAIVDSPDNTNYFDRYVPVPLRFRLLAFLAGFHSEQIGEQRYHSISGNENVNIYWRLTKQVPPVNLSIEDRNSIIRFIAGHGDNRVVVSFGPENDSDALITDTYSMRHISIPLGRPNKD